MMYLHFNCHPLTWFLSLPETPYPTPSPPSSIRVFLNPLTHLPFHWFSTKRASYIGIVTKLWSLSEIQQITIPEFSSFDNYQHALIVIWGSVWWYQYLPLSYGQCEMTTECWLPCSGHCIVVIWFSLCDSRGYQTLCDGHGVIHTWKAYEYRNHIGVTNFC